MNKPQILFVEDDTAVGNLIATTLETQNYQFHRAKNGQQAVLDALSYRPDVMLLDLGLPDIDGIEIIKKVRSWSNMPIIVVSARADDRDKVTALDAGADDYLTKPFSVDELLARLRVALRRVRYDSQKTSEASARYQNGGLVIDYAAGCAYRDGQELHLTPIEYKLLCLLAVFGPVELVVLGLQRGSDEIAHGGVILHEQYLRFIHKRLPPMPAG